MRRPALRRPPAGSDRSGAARSTWRLLVPVVCLVAGIGFAASARDSGGTELRAPGIADLADTVRAAEARVQGADRQVSELQGRLDRATARAGRGDGAVARAQRAVSTLAGPGGMVAAHGRGLVVTLDDAVDADGSAAGGANAGGAGGGGSGEVDPNQLVVHQSDLQAVVNAMWAGGAEAMSIAGQRVTATSAVRCVGNTLLLNGDVFSPPYRVAAIGPSGTMTQRLDASPGVKLFRQAAGYFGLGYTVESEGRVDVPAFRGPTTLIYARPGR